MSKGVIKFAIYVCSIVARLSLCCKTFQINTTLCIKRYQGTKPHSSTVQTSIFFESTHVLLCSPGRSRNSHRYCDGLTSNAFVQAIEKVRSQSRNRSDGFSDGDSCRASVGSCSRSRQALAIGSCPKSAPMRDGGTDARGRGHFCCAASSGRRLCGHNRMGSWAGSGRRLCCHDRMRGRAG